ncbi:CHAT domain-containing protein [Nostoc sp.]|uniref:CHAT domain-containing protein n=1 Tax=Nostoc sp. TaxID=1180 RepID=UPI002FF99D99
MLSNEQRRRLEKERDSLQNEWDIRNDRLMRIRKTLAIETDPSSQFKYEQQIQNEDNELKRLTDRLDEIEKQLQSVEHKALNTQNKSDNSDLINKIFLKAKKVTPEFLEKVPEIEGYSKAEVVNQIYEMLQDGYLEALPLNSQASQYPEDFQNIKITRRGRGFLRNQYEGLVQQQKILILTAIPHGLRLDREIREIEEAIRRATNRNLFEIRIRTAVRPQDIRRAIAEEQPQIVHFCGHGLEDGSLLLEDDGGNNKPVTPEGLASLFKLHANYVDCVLLNACHSEKTAIAISQYINYAIGMNQPIEDKAAITFAQGFYDGLGFQNSGNKDLFQRAFDEGIVAIQMENLSQGLIPVLKKTLK